MSCRLVGLLVYGWEEWRSAFSLDLVAGESLDVADELESHKVGLDLPDGDVSMTTKVININGCAGNEVKEIFLVV